MNEHQLLEAARGGDESAFARLVEPHRGALHAHCYRMLGSVQDAEDALQEALLRAWRGLPRFEGRSSLRSWLYAIATNACLRAIERRPKRVLPVDYGPAADPHDGLAEPLVASLVVRVLPRAACRFNRLSARGRAMASESSPVARSPLSHPKKNCSCATRAPRGGNSCANSRSSSSPLTLPWTRTAPSTSARFAQVEEEHLRMRSLGNRPIGSGEDRPDGLVLLDQGGAQLGQPRAAATRRA